MYWCQVFFAIAIVFVDALKPPLVVNRRSALLTTATAASSILIANNQPALAADDDDNNNNDLTSKLYNADGSVRENVKQEAKEKLMTFQWDVSNDGVVQVDGKLTSGSTTSSDPQVQIEYKVPEKWTSTSDDLYVDPSEGANARAASHIYIYQAPGSMTQEQLAKAGKDGVGKTFQVNFLSPQLDQVSSSDMVSARRVDDDTYEFDMAWAPKTCGEFKDGNVNNLGLGFCPYEQIFLLRAQLCNERLYVLCLQSSNLEWKQANADLKRIRRSFQATSTVQQNETS